MSPQPDLAGHLGIRIQGKLLGPSGAPEGTSGEVVEQMTRQKPLSDFGQS